MPDKVQRVRQQVRNIFAEMGAADNSWCESVLIRDGFYCGHKFGSEGISAVWFCEEDEIKVYSPDRSLVLVAQADDASPVPLRRAA